MSGMSKGAETTLQVQVPSELLAFGYSQLEVQRRGIACVDMTQEELAEEFAAVRSMQIEPKP